MHLRQLTAKHKDRLKTSSRNIPALLLAKILSERTLVARGLYVEANNTRTGAGIGDRELIMKAAGSQFPKRFIAAAAW
jgi:hypothetical protein